MHSDNLEEAYEARAQFEEQYHSLIAQAQTLLADNPDEDIKRDSGGFVTGSEDGPALVRVVSSNSEKHTARMLLDNGSTSNFITESLCDKLNLPRSSASSMVTDASETAYGACVYIRSVDSNGFITVRLLISKSRVAPIKPTTTPRLELCGALLGSRLCTKVKESITIPIHSCYFWCDSTIVLGWLKTSTSQLKKFVANRVNEIQENTSGSTWSYVPSKLNPSDILSRGLRSDLIRDCKIWWDGPQFLEKDESFWPSLPKISKENLPETICNLSVTNSSKNNYENKITQSLVNLSILQNLIDKYSDINKLQRVVAYILRFIYNLKNKNNKIKGFLTCTELQNSLNLILHASQLEMFPEEYSLLKEGKSLPRKNRLISLTPFLDANNLIRVGGRLANSQYDYNVKHSVILCNKHPLTKIIFRNAHERLLHGGPQLLLSFIRQSYWPLGGRNLAKGIVNKCVQCFRQKATSIQPIMGQSPACRSALEFPFLHCSADYGGPILIADRKGRGCKLIKSYLCIFTCLAVKAVHLELVTDLTKEAYLATLNRFISRRGKPQSIMSDNGTNFVGAANLINNMLQESNAISTISQEGIEFSFSPAYSPHFNGVAEAAVRCTKYHLKRLLKLTNLTYEEMATLLTQIEGILNSRPITPLSNEPSDLTALTPSHFLIGRPLLSVPHPCVSDVSITSLERYKRVELLRQHFWNRFHNEYVLLLQQKTKWTAASSALSEGALVLVKDKSLPPLLWLLGRVQKVYPGGDGVVRVADILTRKGTLRRGFNNICPLPIEDNSSTRAACPRMDIVA
ncbi:uncharacterized protein LOC121725422 isoform X2 [Aricia agestis]|nr:uncharacterized protein LOC121725422 isoform X2 [Aricia agestis]XP_041968349.1 uncharacterized protein LOC121725422 isoform X2 [Aricia agestis]